MSDPIYTREDMARAFDEGWDAGYNVGYEDAVNPDAPGFQRHNPYASST